MGRGGRGGGGGGRGGWSRRGSHNAFSKRLDSMRQCSAYLRDDAVEVVEDQDMRELYEHGFYGKGTVSRRQPNRAMLLPAELMTHINAAGGSGGGGEEGGAAPLRSAAAIALSSGLTSARSIGWYYPVTGEAVGQSLHAQPVQLTPTSLVAADGTLYAAMHEAVTNASWMVSIDPSCTSSNTSGGPACAGVPLAFVNQSLSELACGGGACAGLLSPSGDLVIANTGASFPQGLSLRYRVPLGAYARGFVSPVMAGGGAGGGASTVYAASVSGDLFAVDAATGLVTARAQLSANWAQWPSDSPLPRPTQVTVQELALGGSALLVSAQDSNLQTGAILVGFPASASPAPPAPAPAAKAPATLTPSGAAGLGVGLTLAACAALALALQWRGCIQVSLGSGKGGEQRLPLINFTSK